MSVHPGNPLDAVAAAHREWIASRGDSGTRAVLTKQTFQQDELPNGDWRGADLSGSVFDGLHLTDLDLRGAVILRASFQGTTFAGKARLDGLNFAAAGNRSILARADLTNANLTGADLSALDLTGTTLTNADLSDVDLRGTAGVEFDATCIRRTRLSPNYMDRWSVLRRAYSGSNLLLNLILLLAFFLPLGAKVLFWTMVGKVQEATAPAARAVLAGVKRAAEDAQMVLRGPLPAATEAVRRDAHAAADELEKLITEAEEIQVQLDQHGVAKGAAKIRDVAWRMVTVLRQAATLAGEAGPELLAAADRIDSLVRRAEEATAWDKSRVIWRVLGADAGWLYGVMAVLIVIYNAIRWRLTFKIAPLRDEEERSHYTPERADIDRYYRYHTRWVRRLAYVSMASLVPFGLQIIGILWTPVWVPPG